MLFRMHTCQSHPRVLHLWQLLVSPQVPLSISKGYSSKYHSSSSESLLHSYIYWIPLQLCLVFIQVLTGVEQYLPHAWFYSANEFIEVPLIADGFDLLHIAHSATAQVVRHGWSLVIGFILIQKYYLHLNKI